MKTITDLFTLISKLGGYTFMKNTLTIILSGLLICGCSQKQASSASPETDFVQAGRDITCNHGLSILHVTKRDGSSVTGIRCVIDPGKKTEHVLTADTGTINPLFTKDGHVVLVELVLHGWKDENGAHDGHNTSIALRQ
jgi:hypothetical protein